ncbi:antitoxin Xre/MbcA/ParS toxin-binding domain-containing protein [Sphingomonas lenta]|uniref:Antitoxin n=1 Tax=Sphingomonas lenta TaxID=1141887 RepID=A0A2A2SBZ6_9SPHN|nr:antitoxin Xre/MbcA/ParS toxin-binding domain-containing protein [Sphingomonas lenta]PAX06710.1 antitoxin [Sphingomonas lenta]
MATSAFSVDRFLAAPPLTRVREVQKGLPVSALRAVADGKVVTIADLVGIVGTRRTLDRRLADDARLSLDESDRLARFAEVLALATQVFGDRAYAMEWLRAPQFDFDGTPPIELMRSYSGSELVINLLQRFRHGMLA